MITRNYAIQLLVMAMNILHEQASKARAAGDIESAGLLQHKAAVIAEALK